MRLATLALVSLLAVPTLARAAPNDPPATKLSAEECLFLLYALEDFYRETWAELTPDDASPPWTSQRVSGFIGQRTAVIGDLTQYMKSRHAPAELIQAFDDYREFLRSGNDLAAKLREREDKHLKFYRELEQRLLTAEQVRQLESNLGVLHAATDAIRGVLEGGGQNPIEQIAGGQAGGLVAARILTAAMENKVNAARVEELDRAKQDAADYERQEGPLLATDLKTIRTEFLGRATKSKDDRAASGNAAGRRIASLFPNTPDADVAFLPTPDAERDATDVRTRNPFLAKRSLLKSPVPKTHAEAKAYLELAAKCFTALDRIPANTTGGKHDPYRSFRAYFAGLSGTAANTAAAVNASNGFAAAAKFRVANPGSELAGKAWAKYRFHEPTPDSRRLAAYQDALAQAYAGRAEVAFRLIAPVVRETPNHPLPEFWYDAARMASVGPKNADVAMMWLGKAVQLGFRDAERARADPDLELVRQRHGAPFEKLLTGAK